MLRKYTNGYDALNTCQNYLADQGSSGGTSGGTFGYSFRVGAGARFVIVVHGVDPGVGCGYALSVDGGSCRPQLNITQIPGSRVDLDWTTAAIGYSLEHTNALRNPPLPLWVPVPNSPTIRGGRFHVIDPISLPPTNNFYRLRKP